MTDPLLEVRGLSVVFQMRRHLLPALNSISFAVDRGEILGFVGESGAGKSITGAAIMGLLDPPGRITGGEILLKGRPTASYGKRLRGSEVGMIFQDPQASLNPLRTVGDQLTETILHHFDTGRAEARQRALRGMEEVGIDPGRFDAYPHTFSGGMRQRIVIALALAAEPDLIIADEPTTALDVANQARILELLRSLCQKRGVSVILITHDMGVIAQNTDRVAVLYAGQIVELGTTGDIVDRPRHPYTRGLVAATPVLEKVRADTVMPQIPGIMPPLTELPTGCRFHPRCGDCMPLCRTEAPEFQDAVACHLYGKNDG